MKASWSTGSTNSARSSAPASRLAPCTTSASVPVIELHISNVHAREKFRHRSVISPIARGIIVGFGVLGYRLAIQGLNALHESTLHSGVRA